MAHQEDSLYSLTDSDLDLSFTSTTTTATTLSSLSFNDSLLSPLHLRDLELLRLIGSGNLARVFHCRLRTQNHTDFALKVIDREALTPKKLADVETEAQILSSLHHPLLPTLHARFDASHYTCLLIDFCPNGDLHSLLRHHPHRRLPIHAVTFFAAEVLVALEYLHAQGIVYRDLKPENILIRADGHIMLSDFDLCFNSDVSPKLGHRIESHTNFRATTCFGNSQREEHVVEFVAEPTEAFSRACVGTHEYLAPEMVSGDGHGAGVDWWGFGILIYELLHGTTPFKGRSKECTLRNIASAEGVRFPPPQAAETAGMAEARDLIEKLLVKNPTWRLGCARGATDIKRHPFFGGIKWPLIRTYRPPEVRGLAVKRVDGAVAAPPRRRRCFWKRLTRFMRTSKHNLNSNHNYYSYVNHKI